MSREGKAAAPAGAPTPWERCEEALVLLSAAGTVVAGAAVALWPAQAAALLDPSASPSFLVRLAGVLFALLGLGYLLEYRHAQGVSLLVAAKAVVALALLGHWIGEGSPRLLDLLAVVEGTLAVVARLVHEVAVHQRWARIRLHLVSEGEERVRPAGEG